MVGLNKNVNWSDEPSKLREVSRVRRGSGVKGNRVGKIRRKVEQN
jgi:hypothetical protein